MSPLDVLSANIEYYRLHAATYDTEEQPFVYQGVFLSNVLAGLEGAREPQTLLDFGAGTGQATSVLMKVFPSSGVTGIDVSAEVIEIAKRKCPGAVFCTFDGKTIPFPDGHFDGVLVSSVLHHVPDYEQALRELIRVCKRNSWIVLTQEPNPGVNRTINTCRRIFRPRLPELLVAAEFHQFSREGGVPPRTVSRILAEAGYDSRLLYGNEAVADRCLGRKTFLYRLFGLVLRLHLFPVAMLYHMVATRGHVSWTSGYVSGHRPRCESDKASRG